MLTQRSQEKEILDLGPGNYTPEEFIHCQKMLFRVNQRLGCLRETSKYLKTCTPNISLLDVGCGGGLFLLELARRFPEMHCTGIDIAAEAIQMADHELELSGLHNVSFQLTQPTLDYPEDYFDVIVVNMVCHHLSDEELVTFLRQARKIAHQQVIINDLHRSAWSYWFFKVFSPVMYRDRIITNDGLVSIKRGFLREDWEVLLKEAGINEYKITWKFPFWWQVVI